MFTWKKLGRIFNPLDVSDKAWLNEFAQGPSVVIFDEFIRIYFSCRPKPDAHSQYISYSAYVDFNRNNLSEMISISDKPVLPLGNIGEFDEFGIYPFSAIRNRDEIVAYYGGWTRCESVPFNVAIGCAKSIDGGKTFTKVGKGPILSYSVNEPFILSSPKIRRFNDKWFLFYIAGKQWLPNDGKPEPVYQIRMATSEDGIDWLKHDKDIIECKLEDTECQASPDVFEHNGLYHMIFSYRYSLDYRCKERGYRLGYAFSKDLFTWTRDDSKVGIDVSEKDWDSQMISYAHVFNLDGKLYMLYLGNEVGRYGFGLAELVTDN